MPIDVLMPQLSPTMTEGQLANWLKAEGDVVSAGDVIAEVETDKATMEVEATDDGILYKILGEPGNDILVGTPIAILKAEGEEVPADYAPVSKAAVAEEAPVEAAPVDGSAPKVAAPVAAGPAPAGLAAAPAAPVFNLGSAVAPKAAPKASAGTPNSGRVVASPLAKRLAAQMGVDLKTVAGSGPRGRILKSDIMHAPSGGGALSTNSRPIARKGDELVKNTPMRRAIAERLTGAKQYVPHFYLSMDVTMDAVNEVRKQLNARANGAYKLTVNDFVMKACALALANNPDANAAWNTDSIVKFGNVDISVAVAIEGGLITPIVFNADQKSLVHISNEVKELVGSAKAGTLKPEQFQGGSFSLSNLGMFGIKNFQAIVNPPQAAILACGGSENRVMADDDGNMYVSSQMSMSLSVDHRVIDGALGALLLKDIKNYLEQPITMMV